MTFQCTVSKIVNFVATVLGNGGWGGEGVMTGHFLAVYLKNHCVNIARVKRP